MSSIPRGTFPIYSEQSIYHCRVIVVTRLNSSLCLYCFDFNYNPPSLPFLFRFSLLYILDRCEINPVFDSKPVSHFIWMMMMISYHLYSILDKLEWYSILHSLFSVEDKACYYSHYSHYNTITTIHSFLSFPNYNMNDYEYW